MLWEDQPLLEIEKKLIERGLRVLIFNPCGQQPDTGDYLSVMNSNVEGLYPED